MCYFREIWAASIELLFLIDLIINAGNEHWAEIMIKWCESIDFQVFIDSKHYIKVICWFQSQRHQYTYIIDEYFIKPFMPCLKPNFIYAGKSERVFSQPKIYRQFYKIQHFTFNQCVCKRYGYDKRLKNAPSELKKRQKWQYTKYQINR